MLNGISKKSAAILFVLAQLLVLVPAVPALAEGPAPDVKPPVADVTTVSAEQMSELAEIAVQSEEYLRVQADGTLTLQINDPAVLGVDQKFLEAYKAGLEELNTLIRAGELTVNPDLSVRWNNELPKDGLVAEPAVPESAQPNWGAYPYDSGVTVYFTYNEAGRIYSHGPSYATTLGAYLERPYTVPHFNYLFTYDYNYPYFQRHRYNYGTYFYTPWRYHESPYGYKDLYFYHYYDDSYQRGRWIRTRGYY